MRIVRIGAAKQDGKYENPVWQWASAHLGPRAGLPQVCETVLKGGSTDTKSIPGPPNLADTGKLSEPDVEQRP